MGQKFINNQAYVVVVVSNDKTIKIAPGQIVEGKQFENCFDPRKSLNIYRGPRPVGIMQQIRGLSAQEKIMKKQKEEDAKLLGLNIEKQEVVRPAHVGKTIFGKDINDLIIMSENEDNVDGLGTFVKKELLDICKFLGVIIGHNTPKDDLVFKIKTQLDAYKKK